jgi:hypothetical protein
MSAGANVPARNWKKDMKNIFWSKIGYGRELGSFIFVCVALVIWVGVRACVSIFQDAILCWLFK